MSKSDNKTTILVAVLSLVGTVGVAIISNYDKLFPPEPPKAIADSTPVMPEPESTPELGLPDELPQTPPPAQATPSPETEAPPDAEPQMTRSEYDQLQQGMTYEEVVSVVGSPGTRNTVNGPFTQYEWEDIGPFGVSLTFMDNRLTSIGPYGHGADMFSRF